MSFQDSRLVAGVAFKKTFSYAGFEMQPKKYKNPKIALLNIELELKAERDNAEIRVDSVEVRNVRARLHLTSASTVWQLSDEASDTDSHEKQWNRSKIGTLLLSDFIVFKENSIASAIAELLQRWLWRLM